MPLLNPRPDNHAPTLQKPNAARETGLIFREETTRGATEVPGNSNTKIGPPVGCDVLAQVVYTAQVGRSLSLSLCALLPYISRLWRP